MRYICKTNEPEVLANFKAQANEDWQPIYDNFSGKVKQLFHAHLIAEQGHICCYCGGRISADDSHIEHFRPQHSHPDRELDYFNLITSCQNKIPPKDPRHCGMGKGDWFDDRLLVSPLISDCGDFFEYALNGEILATAEPRKTQSATETIAKLRLNIPKLQAARAGAIDSLYTDDPDFLSSLSIDEIDKLIYAYDRQDNDGRYQPYCQVLVCLLQAEKNNRH